MNRFAGVIVGVILLPIAAVAALLGLVTGIDQLVLPLVLVWQTMILGRPID